LRSDEDDARHYERAIELDVETERVLRNRVWKPPAVQNYVFLFT
jgi:hypothetical protein